MKRVLIVDDDGDVRRFIKLCLRGLFITDEAGDGSEALKKAEEKAYDCVITDVQMPRMDGLRLLGEIRRRMPRTSVIVMSAAGELYSTIAMENGARMFLPKPFGPDALSAALQFV